MNGGVADRRNALMSTMPALRGVVAAATCWPQRQGLATVSRFLTIRSTVSQLRVVMPLP